jgi:hypothetical protein
MAWGGFNDAIVTLTWTASVTPLVTYNVYRSGVLLGNTVQTRFVDLPAKGTFLYAVTAVDGTGAESIPSSPVAVTIP